MQVPVSQRDQRSIRIDIDPPITPRDYQSSTVGGIENLTGGVHLERLRWMDGELLERMHIKRSNSIRVRRLCPKS